MNYFYCPINFAESSTLQKIRSFHFSLREHCGKEEDIGCPVISKAVLVVTKAHIGEKCAS